MIWREGVIPVADATSPVRGTDMTTPFPQAMAQGAPGGFPGQQPAPAFQQQAAPAFQQQAAPAFQQQAAPQGFAPQGQGPQGFAPQGQPAFQQQAAPAFQQQAPGGFQAPPAHAPAPNGGGGQDQGRLPEGFDINVNLQGAEAWMPGGGVSLPTGNYGGFVKERYFNTTKGGDKIQLTIVVEVKEGGPNDGAERTIRNVVAWATNPQTGQPFGAPEDYMKNGLQGVLVALHGDQALGYGGAVMPLVVVGAPAHFRHIAKEDVTKADKDGTIREKNDLITKDIYAQSKAKAQAMQAATQGAGGPMQGGAFGAAPAAGGFAPAGGAAPNPAALLQAYQAR
jgi:hypothetical protein